MKLICADINKYDDRRRILLTTVGTLHDLDRFKITLVDGLRLVFYSDDADEYGRPDNLVFEGTVEFDEARNRWVASIDWTNFRHMSDLRPDELSDLGT